MIEKIKRKIKTIEDSKIYSISEILNLGVIINTKQVPSAFTIYRLIEGGQLKARNIGHGKKFGRYVVKGEDLKNYLVECYQIVN